jgi:hypothetical protein
MNIDELLNEAAPRHDRIQARTDGLRADVLARATGQPRRHARRPLRVGLAAAVVATVGVGGVAYASGTLPSMVTSIVDDFGAEAGVAAADRPQMIQTADLQLPDGSRFAAWAGKTDAMSCAAYTDRWDGQAVDTGGATCSDSVAPYDLLAWAKNLAGTTYYPVLFGDAGEDVAQVRVTGTFSATGQDVDLTVPVDPATSAYAVELPGTNAHPWPDLDDQSAGPLDSGITLDFLDADGQVLRTVAGPPV